MPRASRIYLTGFMGSGKSTVGPLLADRLGYEFLDLDGLIEERTGATIPQLFEEEGEESFRTWEARLLEEVSHRSGTVIALGGGALMAPANLMLAASTGTIIFLDVPPDELAARLSEADGRPLLDNDGDKISQLLARRRPIYEKAHITVHVTEQTAEEIADDITKRLSS